MSDKHTISFSYAFQGLAYALRTQPNFLIHLLFSSLAVLMGYLLEISTLEWIILSLVIAVGLVIELINTSIEAVVDLVTQEHRLSAKIAKDVSAAAMLIYAFGAIVVALIIFIPKLWLYI